MLNEYLIVINSRIEAIMNLKEVKTVEEYFKNNALKMVVEPYGKIKYPFIDPGQQYGGDLWDWDSCLSALGLMEICEYFKDSPDFDYENNKNKVIEGAKGCVLNFTDVQLDDGFIPIVINNGILSTDRWIENHYKSNQHKPFLAQATLNVSRYANDYTWFDVEKLIKYIDYYKENQYHKRSGLYVWKNDYMIGIDNNPTVFGFPNGSVGDIYLNTFMYLELTALSELLEKLGDIRSQKYFDEAKRLKETIRKECYDNRDGFYYSVFVDLASNHTGNMHSGMEFFWKSLPIKVRFAGCFLPFYAGISDEEQNKSIIKHYLDEKFLSPNGLRSTAEDERVYFLGGTSNPSNSLGPVWLIYNYFVFEGLLKAGRKDLAEDLCGKIIHLYARDIEKNGKTDECYHPITGEPIMGHSFLSWNCLIIKMLKEIK